MRKKEKDQPELAALARQGFRFKKELGQNFLFNSFLLGQIADSAELEAGDVVIEIGAGCGSLTEALAARGAAVLAIELDRALIPFLRQRFRQETRVEILHGDIMKMDMDALAAGAGASRYKICANLPYHISTALMTRIFRQLRGVNGGAVMLQKEVADKLSASPGGEQYGMLALAAAWYGEAKQIMELEPECFTPPPPVRSAVVAFRRKAAKPDAEEKALWLVIRALFNHRRKNLLNGLKSLGSFIAGKDRNWEAVLEEAGVDYRRRPESLSLEEFASIVRSAGYGAR